MRTLTYILTCTLLAVYTSCDPVHPLTLENRTGSAIEVIYYPRLVRYYDKTPEVIDVNGHKMNKIVLDSAETIQLGTVVAMYTPSALDIDLDYLEVRYGQDTIRLTGKNAILTTFQKVKNLDWRIIVR